VIRAPRYGLTAECVKPLFGPERFTYQPESNSYLCPAVQQRNYGVGMAVTARSLTSELAPSAGHARLSRSAPERYFASTLLILEIPHSGNCLMVSGHRSSEIRRQGGNCAELEGKRFPGG
jgi:hypothetical protein